MEETELRLQRPISLFTTAPSIIRKCSLSLNYHFSSVFLFSSHRETFIVGLEAVHETIFKFHVAKLITLGSVKNGWVDLPQVYPSQ